MNRPVILFAAFFLLSMSAAHAGRLLIDDFSIDQQGIETDQIAAFDLLEDPRLFGGGREIWGGGASVEGNCEDTRMTASVSNGLFQIVNGADCHGAAAVTWPQRDSVAAIDLSEFLLLQLDVATIVGEVVTGITVDSNTTGKSQFVVIVDSPGLHTFRFPVEADLSSVRRLTISSVVEQTESFALTGVFVAVPEPRSLTLFLMFGVWGLRHALRS